jgi:hypothetical protein
VNKLTGAPASPSGSRPSDQANLRCPDAPRFDPSRAKLAVERVRDVLNMVDCGYGHFITGDNLKIMDVQILLDAFYGERADVLAFLRAEADAARHAQGNAPSDHPDKLYRMGQKDGLLLAATAIENWHHLNAASGMDARQGGSAAPSRSDDSPTAESGDAQDA